ncbi:hypothetical protein QJQ45_030009 [Haematococcus lacustris]|nr:hypothetical protein QJQ45_030009 [Haematococcus lacustris]
MGETAEPRQKDNRKVAANGLPLLPFAFGTKWKKEKRLTTVSFETGCELPSFGGAQLESQPVQHATHKAVRTSSSVPQLPSQWCDTQSPRVLNLTARAKSVRGWLHYMVGMAQHVSIVLAELRVTAHTRRLFCLPLTDVGQSMKSIANSGSSTQDAEDNLLRIASRLGLVREHVPPDMLTNQRPKAASSLSMNHVSPLGIAFKVFEKLQDSVTDPNLTTGEVVHSIIMPQTAQLKCRFCDLVADPKLQDSPTFYVVHSWQASFVAMMEAVRQYVLQLRTNTEDVYLWIDILCINQHIERCGSDMQQIKDVIGVSDRLLFILDKSGLCLQRTWCLWELWQASLSDRFDKIVMLPTSWSWDSCHHAYLTLDISNRSTCSKERDRLVLVTEMQKSTDLLQLSITLRNALLSGAKREMQRAEKLASINPKRYGAAGSAYALLLFLHSRYSEAEEVVRHMLRAYDRFPSKDVTERDLAAATYQLACILRDQGRQPDAERVLQDFVNQFRGMQDELYMEGVSLLTDILTQRHFYTKAEMLARKALDEQEKTHGKTHPHVLRTLLQLAHIAVSQKLYEEGEEHLRDAMRRLDSISHPDSQESAAALHTLALCMYHTNRAAEARVMVDKALTLRTQLFGTDHPLTLDSKAFQAEMMHKERRLKEAEVLLASIFKSRNRSYGGEHHATLASMGQLADLLRESRKEEDADEMERRIIQVGRQLLRYTKIDKFRSLAYITAFLARRDHLLDKAAMFLAKAMVVFNEKLGAENELTVMTKGQLNEIIDKVKWIGTNALEQAQLFTDTIQYGVAEVMFKQAYSISRLVSPESDHKLLAQSLVDALLGQGKVQEAKGIMRSAGLSRKGMKQNMPASYLRWLNTRVAKYMDQNADADDD